VNERVKECEVLEMCIDSVRAAIDLA